MLFAQSQGGDGVEAADVDAAGQFFQWNPVLKRSDGITAAAKDSACSSYRSHVHSTTFNIMFS